MPNYAWKLDLLPPNQERLHKHMEVMRAASSWLEITEAELVKPWRPELPKEQPPKKDELPSPVICSARGCETMSSKQSQPFVSCKCGTVSYCGVKCREADAASHKAICAHVTTVPLWPDEAEACANWTSFLKWVDDKEVAKVIIARSFAAAKTRGLGAWFHDMTLLAHDKHYQPGQRLTEAQCMKIFDRSQFFSAAQISGMGHMVDNVNDSLVLLRNQVELHDPSKSCVMVRMHHETPFHGSKIRVHAQVFNFPPNRILEEQERLAKLQKEKEEGEAQQKRAMEPTPAEEKHRELEVRKYIKSKRALGKKVHVKDIPRRDGLVVGGRAAPVLVSGDGPSH